MRFGKSSRYLFAGSGVLLVSAVLAGCNAVNTVATPVLPRTGISGNWEMHAAAGQGSGLPEIAGSFASVNGVVTGVVHTPSLGACISPVTYLAVSGTVDAEGILTLTSTPFNGSVLTVTGNVSADGSSLTGASYTVAGGACAFAKVAGSAAVPVTATLYQPIAGTYTGTFVDTTGSTIAVSAALSQLSAPDAQGVYHLSGNTSFPGNPCLASPAVTDSTVTGSSVSTTYSQTANGVTNTVTAAGTFSPDASVLTVTSWTLSGGCGSASGTGTLTKH